MVRQELQLPPIDDVSTPFEAEGYTAEHEGPLLGEFGQELSDQLTEIDARYFTDSYASQNDGSRVFDEKVALAHIALGGGKQEKYSSHHARNVVNEVRRPDRSEGTLDNTEEYGTFFKGQTRDEAQKWLEEPHVEAERSMSDHSHARVVEVFADRTIDSVQNAEQLADWVKVFGEHEQLPNYKFTNLLARRLSIIVDAPQHARDEILLILQGVMEHNDQFGKAEHGNTSGFGAALESMTRVVAKAEDVEKDVQLARLGIACDVATQMHEQGYFNASPGSALITSERIDEDSAAVIMDSMAASVQKMHEQQGYEQAGENMDADIEHVLHVFEMTLRKRIKQQDAAEVAATARPLMKAIDSLAPISEEGGATYKQRAMAIIKISNNAASRMVDSSGDALEALDEKDVRSLPLAFSRLLMFTSTGNEETDDGRGEYVADAMTNYASSMLGLVAEPIGENEDHLVTA